MDLFIIVKRQLPSGSWQVATPRIFDDKEKAINAIDGLIRDEIVSGEYIIVNFSQDVLH